MKLNDDVLEPTPFQSPFHLTASGNSRRETARSRSGHTHTDTSLSSLASRPLSPSPPQRPLSLSPLPRPWKHLVTGRKGFSGQHPDLGLPPRLRWTHRGICARAGGHGVAQVTAPPPQVAGSWGQGFFAEAWGSAVRVKSPMVTHPQEARVLERSLPSGAGALQRAELLHSHLSRRLALSSPFPCLKLEVLCCQRGSSSCINQIFCGREVSFRVVSKQGEWEGKTISKSLPEHVTNLSH